MKEQLITGIINMIYKLPKAFIAKAFKKYSTYLTQMVKNLFGGSSHKKQARSNVDNTKRKTFVRTAREEGEIYAHVNKNFGNGMCNVVDMNGKEYLCIIRGKFRGKDKKSNKLEVGSWVLVGTREWESTKQDTKPKCDLLEIYNKDEFDKLKTTVQGNWITEEELREGNTPDIGVDFTTNEDAFEYEELQRMAQASGKENKKIGLSSNDWLCEDGNTENSISASSTEKQPRHINRRFEEYVDIDSI